MEKAVLSKRKAALGAVALTRERTEVMLSQCHTRAAHSQSPTPYTFPQCTADAVTRACVPQVLRARGYRLFVGFDVHWLKSALGEAQSWLRP